MGLSKSAKIVLARTHNLLLRLLGAWHRHMLGCSLVGTRRISGLWMQHPSLGKIVSKSQRAPILDLLAGNPVYTGKRQPSSLETCRGEWVING
jgi:hypothetical protein